MDIQEFKTEVLPAKNKLYRLAKVMLQDKEQAEDLLQEVFLKLWTLKDKLHAYKSIEAFAMTITRNLCLDQLKKSNRKQFMEIPHTEIQAKELTPAHRYEQLDNKRKAVALLQQLPEQQKLVVLLRDVEGYPLEEIEQISGLTINNIRVLLSRGRKRLRNEFLKLENYEKR